MSNGNEKYLRVSVTFWGIIIAVAGPILIKYGIDVPQDMEFVQSVAELTTAVIGGLVGIWGRIRANTTIKKGV